MIKQKSILFISAVCPPSAQPTSTDIMTNNILKGLKECGYNIILCVVSKNNDNIDAIKNYYLDIANDIIILPSFFESKMSPFKFLYSLYKNCFFINKYRKQITKYINLKFDLIISNHVYFDEACYGKCIKDIFCNIPYYQYWSDPMTLSGITPDSLKKNFKRWPFYFLEKKAISWADRIIYGTKTLMYFQKELFSSLSDRMFYIDASYIPESISDNDIKNSNKILYAGNYYKAIRNIQPLLDSVGEMPEFELDIYGTGDVRTSKYKNIHFNGRISSDAIQKVEKRYFYSVCILNHSCIQIPGKIFYGMMRKGNILVITDGKYADILIDYLKHFKRFIICRNEKESIKNALINNMDFCVDYEYIENNFSAQKISYDLANGGNKI